MISFHRMSFFIKKKSNSRAESPARICNYAAEFDLQTIMSPILGWYVRCKHNFYNNVILSGFSICWYSKHAKAMIIKLLYHIFRIEALKIISCQSRRD